MSSQLHFTEAAGSKAPPRQLAKVMRAADRTQASVKAHHAKHEALWTQRRYGALLVRSAMTLAPAPPGLADDPKARLMDRARAAVAAKRENRLAQVERAKSNMLRSGHVRETRKPGWGKGLGE